MKRHLLLVLLVATSVAAQTDKPDKKTGAVPAAAVAKRCYRLQRNGKQEHTILPGTDLHGSFCKRTVHKRTGSL